MNIECPVCLNDINEDQRCTTDCEHEFCYDCLNKWLRINLNCPVCRKSVDNFKYNNEINRLFIVNNSSEIENLNINIEEVRSMLGNVDLYNNKIKKLLICLKAISGFSLLLFTTSIYLVIECNEF